MSSWLSHAADLLARVAMNRLRLAFCSRASELAILGAVVSTCRGDHRGGAIWYPFSSTGLGLRLACPRYLLGGARLALRRVEVWARLSEKIAAMVCKKKGTQIHSIANAPRASDRTAPKIGKILRVGHQRFSTAFQSRVSFVRGSRGVRRDEAATISSTDLGDRAEH